MPGVYIIYIYISMCIKKYVHCKYIPLPCKYINTNIYIHIFYKYMDSYGFSLIFWI